MAFFYILSFLLIISVSSAVSVRKQLHHLVHIPENHQNHKQTLFKAVSKLPASTLSGRVRDDLANNIIHKLPLKKTNFKTDFLAYVDTLPLKSSTPSYRLPISKNIKPPLEEAIFRAHKNISPKHTTLSPAETDLSAYEKASTLNKETSTTSFLPISARQSKLSGEPCNEDSECAVPRRCVDVLGVDRCIPNDGLIPCNPGTCTTPGEVCALIEIVDSAADATVCLSQTQTTPIENEPCIAVDSLQHLSREQLVFEKDRLANVLCDENDSCATPGHMVLYHGNGMMMKSYCGIVGGCVKKVMYVNSPRYRKAITVTSKSENMVFTAFSARYVTSAEEGFLSAAIRLGF